MICLRISVLAILGTLSLTAWSQEIVNPDPALPPPMDAAPTNSLATPDPLAAPTTDPVTAPAININTPVAPLTAAPEPAPSQMTDQMEPEVDTTQIREEYERKKAIRDRAQSNQVAREMVPHQGGQFGIDANFALGAFGGSLNDASGVSSPNTTGAVLKAKYYPFTSAGRFGLGPQAGWSQGSGTYVRTITSYGAEAEYAADFSMYQLLVPFAFLGLENVGIKFKGGDGVTTAPAGKSYSQSYWGAGLAINLNLLEHRTASRSLADTGIKKFYLIASWKQPVKSESLGNALLGLRFEF
jgi:hypothetical protein